MQVVFAPNKKAGIGNRGFLEVPNNLICIIGEAMWQVTLKERSYVFSIVTDWLACRCLGIHYS
ncbi:hypothetical protein AYJ02_11980 [Shewanella algae]|nr:hypothetical protein AYJ02_11980 [Shewanella algae]